MTTEAVCRINRMEGLEGNWDGYGAPPPNAVAIRNARLILAMLEYVGAELPLPVPDAEGGVYLGFGSLGNRHASILADNDGGVRYLTRDTAVSDIPQCHEVTPAVNGMWRAVSAVLVFMAEPSNA